MIIESLELSDFRNYESMKLNFSSGTNILYGDNAQGKTNILEAIFLCATTKSHKSAKDKEIIRFGKEEGHIRMNMIRDDATYRLDLHLRANRSKGIAIDGQRLKKASDLIGRLNVVFFSPQDLSIIQDGPSERRRFMDMELCQLDPDYLFNLTRYGKVLQERNRLLKDWAEHPEYGPLIEVQDDQLVQYGRKIIEVREKFIQDLNALIGPIHHGISGGREDLSVYYEPNVTAASFGDQLRNAANRDRYLRQTTVGPQKDDFSFMVLHHDNPAATDAIDIRRFGSQGQQRTASLSLKLSEIEIVKAVKHDNPVLLLDDVLSELDSRRQNDLLSTIGGIQTIITCTGLDEFVNHRFAIDRVFHVERGTVTQATEEI